MFELPSSTDPAGVVPRSALARADPEAVRARSVAEVVLDRFVTSLIVEVGAVTHVRPGAAEPTLEEAVPGPGLAARLVSVPLGDVGRESLLDVVEGWERLASWAVAQQARALEELAARTPFRELDFLGDEVAARLAWTRRAAEDRLALAGGLTDMPEVHDALGRGEIDVRKADALVRGVAHVPLHRRRELGVAALAGAAEETAPQLRERLRRLTAAADPADAEVRHRAERDRRHVTLSPAPDAMAWLTAYLPAHDAVACLTAIDALAANPVPGDDRGADARRADALVDVLRDVLDVGVTASGAPVTARHGRRPHLQVTVAATTLLGLDDEPATLAGYGPVPATMARRIAADGTWRRLLTDAESGVLLHRGRVTYRPGADLTGTVIARDVTCRFPGCRVPADRCDLDHVRPFDTRRPAADQTTPENLQALCRHHHRLKTHTAWAVHRDATTGITSWRSPGGRSHRRLPEALGPPAGGRAVECSDGAGAGVVSSGVGGARVVRGGAAARVGAKTGSTRDARDLGPPPF